MRFGPDGVGALRAYTFITGRNGSKLPLFKRVLRLGGNPFVCPPVSSWGLPLRAPSRVVLGAAPACAHQDRPPGKTCVRPPVSSSRQHLRAASWIVMEAALACAL